MGLRNDGFCSLLKTCLRDSMPHTRTCPGLIFSRIMPITTHRIPGRFPLTTTAFKLTNLEFHPVHFNAIHFLEFNIDDLSGRHLCSS